MARDQGITFLPQLWLYVDGKLVGVTPVDGNWCISVSSSENVGVMNLDKPPQRARGSAA